MLRLYLHRTNPADLQSYFAETVFGLKAMTRGFEVVSTWNSVDRLHARTFRCCDGRSIEADLPWRVGLASCTGCGRRRANHATLRRTVRHRLHHKTESYHSR